MYFFDHSFAPNFFIFHFVAKPMLEFRENVMFFRIVQRSSNYNYLSGKKVLFSRHRKWRGALALLTRLLRQLTLVYAIILPVFES